MDNIRTTSFSIAEAERDTGLSKDVLRVWERRYGFPNPMRDPSGERVYPAEQVERLRLIKKLMDQGHRPGKLILEQPEDLSALLPRRGVDDAGSSDEDPSDIQVLLNLIKQNDTRALETAMQQRLARQGFHRFVLDTVAPLSRRVGEAWEEGSIEVFEEHLFTEQTKRLLRQAIANLPNHPQGPSVLLTTVPEERHVLGLLMVEGLLVLEGARCISLGTQTPLVDIAKAAQTHQIDIVALSFSAAFPRRQIPTILDKLRDLLPPTVSLWAGGLGAAWHASNTRWQVLHSFEEALLALKQWQSPKNH